MFLIILHEALHIKPGKTYFYLVLFPTDPPELCEYVVEVEIRTVDVEVLEQLKDIVNNTSFPIRVSDSINITEVNITITGKKI